MLFNLDRVQGRRHCPSLSRPPHCDAEPGPSLASDLVHVPDRLGTYTPYSRISKYWATVTGLAVGPA